MKKLKRFFKRAYTYFWNWNKIRRFKQFGKGSFLGKRLEVQIAGDGISIGKNVRIGNDARLACFSAQGHTASIQIKDGVYAASNFSVLTGDSVVIEENVLIASYVNILAENHGMTPTCGGGYGCQPLTACAVKIRRSAWLGQNVTIVASRNLEIGEWSIIGAGSVVTKSIPPYSIAVGNPARVVKQYDFEKKEWVSVT